MNVRSATLIDERNRIAALTDLDRSFIVEAGAGSGKTALMAGRVAMLLASGIAPKSIAAVTFTEIASSELLARVRDFIERLCEEDVPIELRAALGSTGLSNEQTTHLIAARNHIDEITCSTIHGFCQVLIKPYPAEADIDPGATVVDQNEGDAAFAEILESWLRDRLTTADDAFLATLITADPDAALKTINSVACCLRRHRDLAALQPSSLAEAICDFLGAVDAFADLLSGSNVEEPETVAILTAFTQMVRSIEEIRSNEQADTSIAILKVSPDASLCTKGGALLKYRKKGAWKRAAKGIISASDADALCVHAEQAHEQCCKAWSALIEAAAAAALAQLVEIVRPVIAEFQAYKRDRALLDFDDLIHSCRDLLRDHAGVRSALALRHAHVLVDEFQDTDPLQAEIFWRLCGEGPSGSGQDWKEFPIRPGALFLVGDPKQAIYRFRGADVNAYVEARDAMRRARPDGLLEISTNFRSCRSVLKYVNARFSEPLKADGQPGFTPLAEFLADHGDGPFVAALDVVIPTEKGCRPSAEEIRDCEAEAVAKLCAGMIGFRLVFDPRQGQHRECRAGDIALLAPTGTDLWRYEQALDLRGIPVATQAGKGFFHRQEIQDLIALTRTLADSRDTLAFVALLRGPLVGLSEKELLDIVAALPPRPDRPDDLPRFGRSTSPESIPHSLARWVVERLQDFARKVNDTTPHVLLSQAIDELRVRPVLLHRHPNDGGRVLANLDRFLELSHAYRGGGLPAFAKAMSRAWQDGDRSVEGRPDAQEESVSLITMHSAKGLEWPVVIPVNTATKVFGSDPILVDRRRRLISAKVLGREPAGYKALRDEENDELNRERVRLWYVAATRARDLLVLPRPDCEISSSNWNALVDLDLDALPAMVLPEAKAQQSPDASAHNQQAAETFRQEGKRISAAERDVRWITPSRREDAGPALLEEQPLLLDPLSEERNLQPSAVWTTVQGGRERGLILHKLLEEVLNGETQSTVTDLTTRASDLIGMLGMTACDDPSEGPCPAELADTIARTLVLPEVAALRPHLRPEFTVFSTQEQSGSEDIVFGIADAVAVDKTGSISTVVDWKSDVHPSAETVAAYRDQVKAYLEATGCPKGALVFLSIGRIVEIVNS